MTGQEVWHLIAPMIFFPLSKEKSPEAYDAMIESYTIAHIGTRLYDNWVANGRPEEWTEKPKRRKNENA